MSEDIKTGDVVRLKSDAAGKGPAMTVGGNFGGRGNRICHWIDDSGEPKQEVFHKEALVRVKPKSDG